MLVYLDMYARFYKIKGWSSEFPRMEILSSLGHVCSYRTSVVSMSCSHIFWWNLQNREYLPMGGSVKMIQESLKLAYGEDSEFIKDKRIAAVQALSGTGACRLFADFQKRFLPDSQIYIPTPTWAKWVWIYYYFSLSSFPKWRVNKFSYTCPIRY